MARPRQGTPTTTIGTNTLDLSPQYHKLRRVAATLVVTVPVDFVRELGWERLEGVEGALQVSLKGRRVVVEEL